MASLSAIRRDDRGQLLLVGAFILAILLVALAVVLNAALYTETLAARGNDRVDVSDTVQYRDDTERALTGLVANVNDRRYVSRDDARANLTAGVADWDAMSARQQAATGRATSVTVTDDEVLTDVSQTNESLSFANSSSASDWTAVTNVTDTSAFVLRVDPADLNTTSNATDLAVLADETFGVEVTNGTDAWRLFVFQGPNASSVTLVVDSPTATTVDTVEQNGTDPVVVDVVAHTVDGDEYANLSVFEGVTGPYTVSFVNGDDARGSYTLLVDGDANDAGHYATDSDAGPTARAVVTRVDVTLRYVMANLGYETPISVTAGGADV